MSSQAFVVDVKLLTKGLQKARPVSCTHPLLLLLLVFSRGYFGNFLSSLSLFLSPSPSLSLSQGYNFTYQFSPRTAPIHTFLRSPYSLSFFPYLSDPFGFFPPNYSSRARPPLYSSNPAKASKSIAVLEFNPLCPKQHSKNVSPKNATTPTAARPVKANIGTSYSNPPSPLPPYSLCQSNTRSRHSPRMNTRPP